MKTTNKMKIPKTLKAFGYNWKITRFHSKKNGNKNNGAFLWDKKEIQLDVDYGDEENIFLHELMECILKELHYRFYGQEGSMEYIFHFDHSGFIRFHSMFYQIMKDNKIL